METLLFLSSKQHYTEKDKQECLSYRYIHTPLLWLARL